MTRVVCRWAAKPLLVDGLSLVSEHLFSLPPLWRGAVAAHLYVAHVLPFVRLFLSLEEDLPKGAAGLPGAASASTKTQVSAIHPLFSLSV